MTEKKSFFEKYSVVFDTVCRLLGNGWRVNRLDDCEYRIKLTSPVYRGFSIMIRNEKQRLHIGGSADSRLYRGTYYKCTLAQDRTAAAIARTIEQKILLNAAVELTRAKDAEKAHQKAQESDIIIKGMLSRLVKLEGHYNAFTGFTADNGLYGSINTHYDGYSMTVKGLSTENLIKLTGMIKLIETG